MRVIVIGTARERRELRDALERSAQTVVGEFASIGEARRSGLDAEAIVAPIRDADADDDPPVEPLTQREIEVIELVAQGLSNRAIADRMAISDQTVKFHVASIAGKLGAANRTDAVRRAARAGLITL